MISNVLNDNPQLTDGATEHVHVLLNDVVAHRTVCQVIQYTQIYFYQSLVETKENKHLHLEMGSIP